MNEPELPRVNRGEPPRASHYNTLVDSRNAARNMRGDGAYIAVEDTSQGRVIKWIGGPVGSLPAIPAKITGAGSGTGFYRWTQQVWNPTGAAWTAGYNTYSTLGEAYEVNGLSTVATDTFVLLHRVPTNNGKSIMVFQVGGAAQGVFPIRCIVDGGSNGDATTTASYTYTVTDINGTAIGSNVALARTRTAGLITAYTVSYGFGMGFYDGEGTFKLWDAGERPQTTGLCVT